MYMEEEETRYLLPLKEYIAYCDALRLELDHHKILSLLIPLTTDQCSDRSVVRRHEMMQKHLEKCEEIMSAKSEAKDALAKEVRYTHTSTLNPRFG